MPPRPTNCNQIHKSWYKSKGYLKALGPVFEIYATLIENTESPEGFRAGR